MSGYWIGGYTRGDDDGVRRLDADGAASVAVRTPDPSYLLASPRHDGLLYAVDEGGNVVVAIRTDGASGTIAARVRTVGDAPCHLAVVADGRLLVAACYGDGRVSVHPLDVDGLPGPGAPLPPPPSAPTGPHPAQDGPHAHCCLEVGELLLVADLGTDRVAVYRRDGDGFVLDGDIVLPASTGPRDLLLHPSGRVLLLGEHDARVHVLDLEGREVLASVPTTIDPADGDQAAAMTLRGDRLTAGLRGSDRIAELRVGDDGVPAPVSSVPSGGRWPRFHLLDGERLLVTNERSGTVTAVPIGADGALGAATVIVSAPAPTHLLAVDRP